MKSSLLRQDVEGYFKQGTKELYVFVDEVQKIPALLDEIQWMMEKYRERIHFILSGSSARKLKRSGANLLAGRAPVFFLFPFTSQELGDRFDLRSALQWGTIPVVWKNAPPEGKEAALRTYTDTYLREEIKQEALSRNVESFAKFLEIVAQVNGEPLNYTNIARQCHISSPNTVKEYCQILFDTLIAFQITGWSHSVRKQVQKSPKLYFFDCGVLNALRHELLVETNFSTKRTGKLFESFVMQEIYRLNQYWRLDYTMHYWRTSHGQEIDLVLQKGSFGNPIAIEIKSSDIIFDKDLSHLLIFKDEEPKSKLYCFAHTVHPAEIKGVTVLPWQLGLEMFQKNGL